MPYLGEIRMFAGSFAPEGWAFCDGSVLSISANDALFNLIGTTYGGDGQTTFALPDLRGRIPLHWGQGFVLAESGGVETVTLTTQQIPAHNHSFLGSTGLASDANVVNNVVAQATQFFPYLNVNPSVAMAPQSITPRGGSQPHDNFQPYLCVNFIICTDPLATFPSPT